MTSSLRVIECMILLLVASITSQFTSIPSQYYLIDVYRFVDISISNTPRQYGNERMANPSNYPYIAFPVGTCTRNGDDINQDTTQYVINSCDNSYHWTDILRCKQGNNNTCPRSPCDYYDWLDHNADIFRLRAWNGSHILTPTPTTAFGGGYCPYNDTDDIDVPLTRTINYMEIDYYTSSTNSSDGCPGDQGKFELAATDKFATNICVEQDDGTYIKVECDTDNGYINQYEDVNCFNLSTNLLTYTRKCSYFDNPSGDPQGDKWFRRVKKFLFII